jgi:hypothetical protein
MTRKKSGRKLGLSVLALTAILIVSIILLVPLNLLQNSVWSVSNINLVQNGTNTANGTVTGGDWRVVGTTDNSIIQYVTLNQTTMKNMPGTFPSGIAVLGSVTFGIVQSQPPYWHVPLTRIEDITVYPTTYGEYKTGEDTAHSTPPLTVTLWKTDQSQKALIIPFTVGVLKTGGSKLGSLVTDYPGAVLQHSAQGDYYSMSVSFYSIAQMQQPQVITWYNPQDTSQTVTMTLLFTVGGSEFDWTQDYIVVTEQNGGQVLSNNVFPYSSLNQIETELNPALGSSTNFESYWFGGGAWQAEGYFTEPSMGGPVNYGPASSYGIPSNLARRADGSMSPVFPIPPIPNGMGTLPFPASIGVDSEGYKYPTTTVDPSAPSFPGWYVPAPANTEGIAISGDWQNYRLPVGANVITDKNNLRPTGLSVVDFLAAQSINGVSKLGIPAQNYNIWGQSQTNPVSGSIKSYAGAGGADSSLNVAIPLTARSWAFQLDVSTDLVDTVVIQQNYVHVVIDSFTVDRDTVSSGDSAIVTATLRNTNSFSGLAMQGFSLPASLATSCQITGGGGLYFEPNQTQTVNLLITNTGNLVNDTKADFTYSVMNTHGDTTASKTITLTFTAGLGVPDTTLVVNTLIKGTNEPVNGLKVSVYYGQTGALSQTLDTSGGVAQFDLALETGACTLKITDPAGRYADQADYFNIAQGANTKTYYFSTENPATNALPWELLIIIAIVAVALIGVGGIAYYVKKKRRR